MSAVSLNLDESLARIRWAALADRDDKGTSTLKSEISPYTLGARLSSLKNTLFVIEALHVLCFAFLGAVGVFALLNAWTAPLLLILVPFAAVLCYDFALIIGAFYHVFTMISGFQQAIKSYEDQIYDGVYSGKRALTSADNNNLFDSCRKAEDLFKETLILPNYLETTFFSCFDLTEHPVASEMSDRS